MTESEKQYIENKIDDEWHTRIIQIFFMSIIFAISVCCIIFGIEKSKLFMSIIGLGLIFAVFLMMYCLCIGYVLNKQESMLELLELSTKHIDANVSYLKDEFRKSHSNV